MPPKDEKTTTTTSNRRNWSNATLLARLADVLAEKMGESTREQIVRDPHGSLDVGLSAIDVIELLKDRVIVDTMTDRA